MFARTLLVLTVSAISRNAYKWRRDRLLPRLRDAGSAERPRVLLADDHPAMLALTAAALAERIFGRRFSGRWTRTPR